MGKIGGSTSCSDKAAPKITQQDKGAVIVIEED